MKDRGVPLRYVEGLNDATTTLADFFSSLPVPNMSKNWCSRRHTSKNLDDTTAEGDASS